MSKSHIVPAESSATPELEAGQTARLVPALEVAGVFTPGECQRIIGLRKTLGIDEAPVPIPDTGAKSRRTQVIDTSIRNTERTHVVAGPDTRWIYDRLARTIEAANDKTWQFRIALMEPLQLLSYPVDGHFEWHHDLGTRGITALRKVSATILLSEPDSYEGGDLQFLNSGKVITPDRAQGKAILFPAYMNHRVTRVTRGTRHVLILWTIGRRSLR